MTLSAEDERLRKLRDQEADAQTGSGINKNALYGEFIRQELGNRDARSWRDRLYRKAAHKSLDIPDPEGEEMGDIHVTNSRSGMGIKEIVTLGAMALGGIGIWQAPAIVTALKAAKSIVSPDASTDTDTATDLKLGGGVELDPGSIILPSQ